MRYALRVDPDSPVDARIPQVLAELRWELVELEIRMMKWMFTCMIFTFALVMVFALPTLRGTAFLLFVAGSAAQAYVVWRMPALSTP
jgi:hypothetical protein